MSLAEDEYLLLIGQVAYMVSSLEWTILGDLPGLHQYIPHDLNLNVTTLAGKSTGQIAGALENAANSGRITDEDVRTYVEVGGRKLAAASSRRNDLLHARPATVGEHQRLYRWRSGRRQFVIDVKWLNDTIDILSEASEALNQVRPLHKHPAFMRNRD